MSQGMKRATALRNLFSEMRELFLCFGMYINNGEVP